MFKNRLRAKQFEGLLQRLHADRDAAGEQYEALRRKLIKFFEWNACFPPEELVDETFDRVAQRIGELEIRDVVGFAWGVAKNIVQEAHKKEARTVHVPDLPRKENPLSGVKDNEGIIHGKMEQERRAECLHLCILRLRDQDRELFLAYYQTESDATQHRQQLASHSGLTIGTLRVRMNRLRKDLGNCAHRCLRSRKMRPDQIESQLKGGHDEGN